MQSRIPDFASEGDQVRHSGYSRSDPVPLSALSLALTRA